MKQIAFAVVKSGLVDQSLLNEISRWGLPVRIVPENKVLDDADQVLDLIRAAIEEHDFVRLTETDMGVLELYLNPENRIRGTLVLKVDGARTSVNIVFCRTLLGEYAIPWKSESISELMVSDGCYLRYKKDGENTKVQFYDVREVFFGEVKAFMVCSGEESK